MATEKMRKRSTMPPNAVQLNAALKRYKYQPELTLKLDSIRTRDFSPETLYEIVLWKIGRFPELAPDVLTAVNKLQDLAFEDLQSARPVLERLLRVKGIQLPMASTILRFR